MTALLSQLRQGKVETRLNLGPGIHRNTKASAARLAAIDRDDEGTIAPNTVGLVDVLAGEKDPILDGDRTQLAGAYTDKGERLPDFLSCDDGQTIAFTASPAEVLDRRVQKPLPGMGPDRIAKERLVGASVESVLPRVLPIRPSDGKIFETRDTFVDDGAVM